MSEDQPEQSVKGQFRVEDGELVLSDSENQDEKPGGSPGISNSRKSRRKQTFERRNIKKVKEDGLSEEAKAAQKAEMERRQRLVNKEKGDQVRFSNIDFLLNDSSTSPGLLKCSDGNFESELQETGPLCKKERKYESDAEECNSLDNGSTIDSQQSSVEIAEKDSKHAPLVDALTNGGKQSPFNNSCSGAESEQKRAVRSASASLFGSTWSDLQSLRMGQSQDDAILLGDSDDEQLGDSNVIEVSDGEEEEGQGEEEEEEPEVEVEEEICEIQDADNLADIDGKIIINTSRDQEEEPEIVLCPQMARVIKPHQVSGIRFLYDNVVESVKRFQTTEGFGCILAHSMGLGKTIQIIGFLDILFRFCQAQRVLVIVPINTIQNWQAEFELWLPTDLSSIATNKKFKAFHHFAMPKSTNYYQEESKPPMQSPTDHQVDASNYGESNSAPPPPPLATSPKTTEASLEEQMWSSMFESQDKSEESHQEDMLQQEGGDFGESTDPNFSLLSSSTLRPFKLFVVRDTVKTMSQRHQIIQQWFEEGGVLLLGYEMFRLLLNQKRLNPPSLYTTTRVDVRMPKRRKKEICIDIEKEEKREKMWADFHTALLDPGPQLVICDEGHRIKNSEASISKALKAIKTHRRVVLTGYPLQNNLMEYWCMVDFVRPNYLGTKQEFTNMFQRPIENGQCIDSTPEDRKVMQGRAHVLHDLLSGFVQRRSHAVLKASLPPKTEIVLLIKLSPLQRTLYAAFMRSLGSSGPLGWAQVNTLKTYAMCCKIWNHPDILRRAMEEHKEAMDFDIDDSAAAAAAANNNNNNNNSTNTSNPNSMSSIGGGRPYHRSNSTASIITNQNEPQQSWIGGDSNSMSSEQTLSSSSHMSTSANNSVYSVPESPMSMATAYMPQNPHFSVPTTVGTQPNPGQMMNTTTATTPTTTPNLGYFYNQITSSHQATVGTYDWASDQELWGENFQSGNVEHSGKVLLFLDILKGSVLAGDKLLVFTQSLYTLDLLERILRHLPLPIAGKSDRSENESSTASSSSMKPEDTNKSGLSDEFTAFYNHENSSDDHHNQCSGDLDRQPQQTTKMEDSGNDELKGEAAANEEEEETLRSLHYRLSTRRGRCDEPTVWTRNVHYFRLDGSTNASEREKLINNFNDPNNPAKLFLMSTRAGCLGVNLIGANRVVVFDASWNPCHDCQAVCRVYRYGQVKPCYIYRLVSDNTMEKKIYDRQVTKQGMSDRVVDELNPSQQFTRSQVELLMSFEDKDMETITEEDLKQCEDIIQPDPILTDVLKKHAKWITKRPFTHESLLIDRKDYRLTRVEKRMARQRYEQEKRLSLSYQQAHLFQLQQMQLLQQQQQQLLAAGINPSLVDTTRLYNSRTPNILSRSTINYRPTYTSGMAALDAMRQVDRQARLRMLQKDLDEARRRCGYAKPDGLNKITDSPECKVTRIVANTDLFFPSTTNSTTTQRKIPKGEVLEVIQTPKAKYLRISRTGDLFIVKTSGANTTPASTTEANASASSSSTLPANSQENCTPSSDSQTHSTDPVSVSGQNSSGQSVQQSTVISNSSSNTVGIGNTVPSSSSSSSSSGFTGDPTTGNYEKHQNPQTLQKRSYSDSNTAASGVYHSQNKPEMTATNHQSMTYGANNNNNTNQPFNYSQSYNRSEGNVFQQPTNNVTEASSSSTTVAYTSPKRAHSSNETFTSCDLRGKDSSTYQNQMMNRRDNNNNNSNNNNMKKEHGNSGITYPNHTFSSQDPFQSHLQRGGQSGEASWPCLTCGRTLATGCTCRMNSLNTPVRNTATTNAGVSNPPSSVNTDTNVQSSAVASSRFRSFNDCNATTTPRQESSFHQSNHMNNSKKNFPSTTNYQSNVVSVPYYQSPQNAPPPPSASSSSSSSSSASSTAHRQLQQQQQQQHQYLRAAEDIARQSGLTASSNNSNNPVNAYQSIYQNQSRLSSGNTTTDPNISSSSNSHNPNSLQSHVSMMQDYFSQLTNQRPAAAPVGAAAAAANASFDLQRSPFREQQQQQQPPQPAPPSHAVAAAMQQYLAHNSQHTTGHNHQSHNAGNTPTTTHNNNQFNNSAVQYQQFQLAAAAKEQQQRLQQQQQQLLLEQQRQQQQLQLQQQQQRQQAQNITAHIDRSSASASTAPSSSSSSHAAAVFNHLHSQAFPNFHFPQF